MNRMRTADVERIAILAVGNWLANLGAELAGLHHWFIGPKEQ